MLDTSFLSADLELFGGLAGRRWQGERPASADQCSVQF